MTQTNEPNLYRQDAQFYDLDNRDIVKHDIDFYLEHAAKTGGRVLELACGTGRVTIPLARAGHNVWGLEYSEQMLRQFKLKLPHLPPGTVERIHLIHGDMSRFRLGRKFPLIIIPCRSLQTLCNTEKENACLQCVTSHLAGDGRLVIDIGRFIKNRDEEKTWVNDEEVFDWENTDPATGSHVRRTHIKKEIDTVNQVIYPQKHYYVTAPDGTVNKIIKRSPWKYFFGDQIRELLDANGLEIIEEMGYYDGRTITEGSEFIFICRKK
jgi:SAM-dependent methyltransferase